MLLALAAVLGALSFGALTAKSVQPTRLGHGPAKRIAWDRIELTNRLADSLTYATVTDDDHAVPERAQLDGFHAFLRTAFPLVYSTLTVETVHEGALLFTWPGSNAQLQPYVFAAHQDVVPVDATNEASWHARAFGGRASVRDAHVYGRGTMDNKGNMLAMLEAVSQLIRSGHKPRRTLVLAFGHDEEVNGLNGAAYLARELKQRYGRDGLAYILDEGMTIVLPPSLPGIDRPLALIGVSEKGFVNMVLNATMAPGHSSMPTGHTAIGHLAEAITRIEASPVPAELSAVPRSMFTALCPEMPFLLRLIMCNLQWTHPLLSAILSSDPVKAALIQTTTAVTVVRGGTKLNVLPSNALAYVNHRLATHDTVESVLAHDRAAVGDVPGVTVELLGEGKRAAPVTPHDSPAFANLAQAIVQVFPDALVAPSLMIGATDTVHYWDLTRHIFRFTPLTIAMADLPRIHGINERIAIDSYLNMASFYHELVLQTDHSTGSMP